MPIKVQATQRGVYGKRVREKGDSFVIASKADFSKLWMKELGATSEAPQSPPPASSKVSGPKAVKAAEAKAAEAKGTKAPAKAAGPDTEGGDAPEAEPGASTGDANVL
jgi:hypothetical protein